MPFFDLDTLKHEFTGDVISPNDDSYQQVKSVMYAEGEPALVLRPAAVEDVVMAIRYAREHSLALSVRGGGHDFSGRGTNTGGLVIDLSRINQVEIIDDAKRLVRLGGGAVWGDVAKALHEHGLVISSGDTTTVGVGGLTLGGGIGWMARKYGLTIDSLVAVEIVTADGAVIRASADEHPDLFWAVRGGGGNFGVVTSFEFVAQPAQKVYGGTITYAVGDAAAFLRGWRDCMRSASEDLTTMIALRPVDTGASLGMVSCCYVGDMADAAKTIEPLLHISDVTQNEVRETDYADLLESGRPPRGIVFNNMFVRECSDELIGAAVGAHIKHKVIVQMRSLGGAMNRVPAGATAFAHRDSEVLLVSPKPMSPDATQQEIAKALEPWRALAPYGNGTYVNLTSDSSASAVSTAYPTATMERLRKIKKQYDPHNIFN